MVRNSSGSRRRRDSRLFALLAIQMGAQILVASCDGKHPRAIREWRLMAHMLPMAAGQIGNPIAIVILVIADDRLLHVVMIFVSQEGVGTSTVVSPAILLGRANVNVSRTAVRAVERQSDTSSACFHLGRNYR